MKKLSIILLIIIAVFGYAVFDAMRVDQMLVSGVSSRTGSVITTMPDAPFRLLQSPEKLVTVKDVSRGKRVLVHFWATWCAPCEVEFPDLVRSMNSLKSSSQDLLFVLVAVASDPVEVKKFLKKYNVSGENILLLTDDEESHKAFGTYKLPESYLFDTEFRLVKKYPGKQEWMSRDILNQLSKM